MTMLELVIYSGTLFVFISIFVLMLIADAKKRKIVRQLQLTKQVLQLQVETLIEQRDQAMAEKSDGFVKFMSDSRAWAFDYIDEVQDAIQKVKETYDQMAGEEKYNQVLVSKYKESLPELFKLLPEKKDNEQL